jgi:hypothetical protein
LTLPKPTGLINLNPLGRKRGRLRHNVRRMVGTLQSALDRNAFAGECSEAGRVLWVFESKNKNALGR